MTLLLFYSCLPTKRICHNNDEIISYVFPHEIDTLLYIYLTFVTEYEPEGYPFITLGYDHNDSSKNYRIAIQSVDSIYPKNGIILEEHSRLKKYFLTSRTNRYAIINNGEYILPVILYDFDGRFTGYDHKEHPLVGMVIPSEWLMICDDDKVKKIIWKQWNHIDPLNLLNTEDE